ncbi:unnamed protein product [Effrenium voratum]|nr:unnamed protein product [Effrenium voratum]
MSFQSCSHTGGVLYCCASAMPPALGNLLQEAVPIRSPAKPPSSLSYALTSSFAFGSPARRSGDFLEANTAFREMEHPPPRPPRPKGISWDEKKMCSQQSYYEDCIECCREKMSAHPAKCMRKFCTPLLTKPKPQDLQ